MAYKLIIIEKSQIALVYFGNRLINLIMEHSVYRINDIYLGKVSSILPSLGAAFITLDPRSRNGFISLNQLKTRTYSNSDLSEQNKYILVQVTREPIGTKGPNVTCDLQLIGKYLILFPVSKSMISIKNTQKDENKNYLRAISNLLVNSKSSRVLVRSGSIKANIDFLVKEAKILKSRWTKILSKSTRGFKPRLLNRRSTFLYKILETHSNINFDFITIDSYEGAVKIKNILSKMKPLLLKKTVTVEFYKNSLLLIKHYFIDLILSEIIKPRVNLYKGGYIIIEKTEALTTIDINSGSFTNLQTSRQTSLWINYFAVHEILKQIKLRNIGGIIIIDFIDSTNQNDQMKLIRYMSKLIKKDYARFTIIQMSELGLMELTRSRYGQSVYDAFSRRCNVCNGLGYLTIHLNKTQSAYYELILNSSYNYHNELYDRIKILYNKVYVFKSM
jgi:ribonuclease E